MMKSLLPGWESEVPITPDEVVEQYNDDLGSYMEDFEGVMDRILKRHGYRFDMSTREVSGAIMFDFKLEGIWKSYAGQVSNPKDKFNNDENKAGHFFKIFARNYRDLGWEVSLEEENPWQMEISRSSDQPVIKSTTESIGNVEVVKRSDLLDIESA